MDLYAENILDHYKNPQHYGKLEGASVRAADANPLCGDHMEIALKISRDGIIEDAQFTSQGCAISTAAASMLLTEIHGKSVSDVNKISHQDVFDMLQVPLTSGRVKCALLALATVKKALFLFSTHAKEESKKTASREQLATPD